MRLEILPDGLRVTQSPKEAAALTASLLRFYAIGGAVLMVLALLFRRELILPLTAFAAFLVVWSRRVRRQSQGAYLLAISRDEIEQRIGERRVAVKRADVSRARLRRRNGGRVGSIIVLRVDGQDGAKLLEASVPPAAVPAVKATLEDLAWP